ncbi:unnamed protein product, partial [Acanthoscelides obtectus]
RLQEVLEGQRSGKTRWHDDDGDRQLPNDKILLEQFTEDIRRSPRAKVPEDTTAQPPRKVRVTPIVLRDASRWRGVNHKFISLGIKFERAVAVDAGIRIIPKSEDDYRRIIRLFREEEVPHHTFPLPSERNIHAVIRGVHATLSEIEIKEELQQRGYSPLHIIRLKRGGGVPMPLVVVILPKIEKSQQLFNEHELLGVGIVPYLLWPGKLGINSSLQSSVLYCKPLQKHAIEASVAETATATQQRWQAASGWPTLMRMKGGGSMRRKRLMPSIHHHQKAAGNTYIHLLSTFSTVPSPYCRNYESNNLSLLLNLFLDYIWISTIGDQTIFKR